jgi:large subunit ribosomal protein L13
MKTRFARNEDYKDNRRWYHVDASDRVLGRLASRVAVALMGKDRPDYTPNVDTGAYVVVTNAERVHLSGRKMEQKVYRHHSGYPGGLKEVTVAAVLEKHPERVVKAAVRRMLPKGKLGDAMVRKLKIYAGPVHPHTYHKPEELLL